MIGLLGGISAGVGLLGGLFRSAKGAKMARNAQKAIDTYKRQKLQNSFGDVGVSRLGADYMAEQNARNMAQGVDALRTGGMRGLGMIGQLQSNSYRNLQNSAADLDRQRTAIDMARAQDDSRMRAMQERREEQDLAGLGRMLDTGRQDQMGGLQDFSQGLLGLGAMSINNNLMNPPDRTPYVSRDKTIAPRGLANTMGSLDVSANPYLGPQDRGLFWAKPTAPIFTG
jgi:hypothetical protein